ncbi:hypothetical protein GCM10027614_37130 [Micromonospora vulcania]
MRRPQDGGTVARRGRIPHPRTRIAVADILGRDAADLWPEPFRRRDLPWFRPWAELEQDATSLRYYQPLAVPGLLQIEGYAHAMLRVGGVLAPADVEQVVASRLSRQAVLVRDDPPQVVVVIDEVVLRRLVGGRAIMCEQLRHLGELATWPHIQIRVIPAAGPWHTGLSGSFVLARLPDAGEVAYLDNQLRGQIVTDQADVASLGRRWESVAGEALPCRRSVELIQEAAETWR